MSNKSYYIVKYIESQNGGSFPFSYYGINPAMMGPPIIQPTLYPNINTYRFKVQANGIPDIYLNLNPQSAQKLMWAMLQKIQTQNQNDIYEFLNLDNTSAPATATSVPVTTAPVSTNNHVKMTLMEPNFLSSPFHISRPIFYNSIYPFFSNPMSGISVDYSGKSPQRPLSSDQISKFMKHLR